MATIEAPTIGIPEVIEDEIPDIPDMVVHLYKGNGTRITVCGIDVSNDSHVKMHFNYGSGNINAWCGEQECPKCGAPLCSICLATAKGA